MHRQSTASRHIAKKEKPIRSVQTVWPIALQWLKWNSQHVSNFMDSYSSIVEEKFLHVTDIFICSICWWTSWAFNNFHTGQATCKNQKTTQNLVFFSLSVPQKLLSTLWKLLLYFFLFRAKCDIGIMFFHVCHFLGMIKLQMEQQTPVFNITQQSHMLQPYFKQERIQLTLLYLHLAVKVCASSSKFVLQQPICCWMVRCIS